MKLETTASYLNLVQHKDRRQREEASLDLSRGNGAVPASPFKPNEYFTFLFSVQTWGIDLFYLSQTSFPSAVFEKSFKWPGLDHKAFVLTVCVTKCVGNVWN